MLQGPVWSQVRLNRAPEKVSEKVWEALVQSQVWFDRICGHVSTGLKPSRGLAARYKKLCK